MVTFSFEGFTPKVFVCLRSRFRPQGCYLRGFALKVVLIIYLRGFALKVVLFTFEVLPSRLCLPSRFRPQSCYIFPLKFCLQGCLIFAFKVSPWRVINLGIFRACWCVDFMSDMACSCPLINIYLFNSF